MATRRRLIQVSGGALAAAALGRNLQVYAQGSTPEASGSPVVSATPSVEIGDISVLPLKEEGKLIIHTDEPVYEPWFVDNDPANGQGFESAVAFAGARSEERRVGKGSSDVCSSDLQVYAQGSPPEASGSPVVSATPSVEIGDISVLPLKEEGKLIIHTDEPVYEPWFVDNDPANGQGFESAVAFAVA